jgi:hypothetical protein
VQESADNLIQCYPILWIAFMAASRLGGGHPAWIVVTLAIALLHNAAGNLAFLALDIMPIRRAPHKDQAARSKSATPIAKCADRIIVSALGEVVAQGAMAVGAPCASSLYALCAVSGRPFVVWPLMLAYSLVVAYTVRKLREPLPSRDIDLLQGCTSICHRGWMPRPGRNFKRPAPLAEVRARTAAPRE